MGMKDLFIGVVHLFVIFIPGAFVLLSIGYIICSASALVEQMGVFE